MNLTLAIGLLAQEQPRDTGPEFGKASPMGLLILVLLLIGTFLLIRSMNRQLRKLPESFDGDDAGKTQVGDDETIASDADSATDDDAGTDSATDGPKREPGG
ncbi:hypothetical protein DQP55_09210 [Mycolicibacterium sp. GF69]|uniref:hypothetical protein n=1 Tax=Mycolicibacterium sp. GF69 TaxID=2267251 RepID=UPI000DCE98BC|nr:hypothetical protein [Mycolicibacterium sp. GF69]RAV13911.1 hypothetical protein DQP55_09210 [Mycolicibacterium sp. GF69]